MAEVNFLGFGARDGYGPDVGPDVVFDGKGTPVFDGTIDVVFTGRNPAIPLYHGAEFTYDGVGTPVFDGSVDVHFLPPATNFDTDGKDEFFGAKGKPVLDDTIEVLNIGPVLLDFDNTGKNVEFGGTGKPIFPGVAQIVNAIIPPEPLDIEITAIALNKGWINPGEVTYFTTPIKGPTYPVQGPTAPPGVNL